MNPRLAALCISMVTACVIADPASEDDVAGYAGAVPATVVNGATADEAAAIEGVVDAPALTLPSRSAPLSCEDKWILLGGGGPAVKLRVCQHWNEEWQRSDDWLQTCVVEDATCGYLRRCEGC